MPATPAWLASIEAVINRGIEGSSEATTLARRLNATSLRVDVEGVTAIRASVAADRVALTAADEGANDTARLTGSIPALLRLIRGDTRPAGAPRAGQDTAQVRGDAEVANQYRRLFALARPDVEEELARLVGDFPARRLTQFAGRTVAWMRGLQRTVGDNVAEYLQEESRDLVNKEELDEFLRGVDDAREAADRVDARLQRLEQRLKGPA